MTVRRELIDELLKELTRAVIERCLETELDSHLGYPKHARQGNAKRIVRNGHSQKTLEGANEIALKFGQRSHQMEDKLAA